MNLKIINFGLLRPTFDVQTIAKYKRWGKFFGIGSSAAFLIVTGGLLSYKSRNSRDSVAFPSHIVSYNGKSVFSTLSSFLPPLSPLVLEDFSGAQSRCSGIELLFQLLADVSASGETKTVSDYLRRARILCPPQWVDLLNWSDLAAQPCVDSAETCLKTQLLTHIHRSLQLYGVFAPHLSRVPRDIDGKLVVNKDAGCSPPFSLDNDHVGREKAVLSLQTNGAVILKKAIDITQIGSLRTELGITSAFASKKSDPFETRNVDLAKVFSGTRSEGVDFFQLAPERHTYRLRCSELESVVKPIHAAAMPVVWKFLCEQRNDSLLNTLLSGSPNNGRVFLSEVSLVVAEPLAGGDSWHATNGAGGVVVIVPLTPSTNLSILPGSQDTWKSCLAKTLKEGPIACTVSPGDIIVLDARTMRMTNKSELFNRSDVSLVFHYDFTDIPAPAQWITQTVFNNALAGVVVKLKQYYGHIV